ncbi:UBX domain-containing protein 4 [Drosophila bipectinata]|uniref:UBX domain-containing protein 4 n=1 Tax=Drosophila bipectinata TaxID=42026 RepID=UPI001C898946|nr:UBX domain-containing protein 4 [Drosophila bipectinata]
MNWHTGNIAEAVAESKIKNAVFVVFIEGQDEMSSKLERFVDDIRVRSLLETPDFVAIKVQGNSSAYGQFMSLYKVVPIPSLFFIGKTGTPLEIATGVTASVEELVAKIDKVLILAGKKAAETPATSTSALPAEIPCSTARSFAGADDSTSLSNATQQEQPTTDIQTENATSVSKSNTEEVDESPKEVGGASSSAEAVSSQDQPSEESEASYRDANLATPSYVTARSSRSSVTESSSPSAESKGNTPAAEAAVKRAAAAAVAAASTEESSLDEGLPPNAGPSVRNLANALLPTVPLLSAAVPVTAQANTTPTTSTTSDSEARMAEVQKLLEEKRKERMEEERRREKENELRRRREGREALAQQQLAKEQELKNMQERIRRERQEEMEARERIKAQIAADRAEQARRVTISPEPVHAAPSTVSVTPDSSVSSVDEARLQIRLPGGIHHTKTFPAAEVLATVRVYVRNEMLAGSDGRDFTLATNYPRREFQAEDEVKTLIELNLVPSAVVLVLTKDNSNRVVRSGGSLMTMLATVVWAMLTPAAKAFEYINKMGLRPLSQKISSIIANIRWPGQQVEVMDVIQNPAARRNMDMYSLRPSQPPGFIYQEPHEASATHSSTPAPETTEGTGADGKSVPQPQPGPGRAPQTQSTSQAHSTSQRQSAEFQQRPGGYRYGGANIRRLQDTQKEDNDKDKATYNGNSTQQQ